MRCLVAVVVGLLVLSGCSRSEPVAETLPAHDAEPYKADKDTAEPLKQYPLNGEVVRVDTEAQVATIKHEQIGDWMGPMTMEFPVKDPADFAKLTAGKPVHATVNVQGFSYWVSGVQATPEK
jgi:Cu/Ag efflux protein CusF